MKASGRLSQSNKRDSKLQWCAIVSAVAKLTPVKLCLLLKIFIIGLSQLAQ